MSGKKKEYYKEYYQNNSEDLKKYKNEKVLCKLCNCYVSNSNISKHRKSNKHVVRQQELQIKKLKKKLKNNKE